MTLVLIIVIIILALGILGLVIYIKKQAKIYNSSVKEEFSGICKSAIQSSSRKEERKQKIITILREKGELSNSDIRRELGVSSRTTVRYLDELEAEGRVEQLGQIGHTVSYRLK